MIIAFEGATKAQDAVIETNPAIGPVIINIGSGFFITIIPMILEEISPADAAINVLININGVLISIAKLAPPLKPNQPNHKINAPNAAIGVLLPWKVLPPSASPFLNLPVLGPTISKIDSATHPPTEWTTEAPAKSIKPNLPNQPNFLAGFEKSKAHIQWPTNGYIIPDVINVIII